MVVDAEVSSQLKLSIVKDVLNGDLTLVVVNEVFEGNCRLEANERVGEVEDDARVGTLVKQASSLKTLAQTVPRTARRVNLVRLVVVLVLQVSVVLVDEVPDYRVNIVACPVQPVFSSRLNIKDSPTIQLSRVHFANLVLFTVLATVDGSKDESILMEGETSKLAGVSQLEDSLTDFGSRTIYLVEEKHNRVRTSSLVPLRRVPTGDATVGAWQS